MSFNNFFYNLSEYALSSLFRVITGINLKYKEELTEIWIYQLEDKDPATLKSIEEKIQKDFKLKTKIVQKKVELPAKARRGNFLNTTEVAKIIDNKIERPKGTALLCITKFGITPVPFLIIRIMQGLFPILGTSYILYGICFITTLNEKLHQEIINYAAVHEIGHLMGKHGYPL